MCRHPGALSPDTVSFNTVLRALATAGRAVEAQALYKRMLGTGVKETAASVAALMAAATANGQAEWALTMWQGLQRGSLRPTAACATARMDALLHLARSHAAAPHVPGSLDAPPPASSHCSWLHLASRVLIGYPYTRQAVDAGKHTSSDRAYDAVMHPDLTAARM